MVVVCRVFLMIFVILIEFSLGWVLMLFFVILILCMCLLMWWMSCGLVIWIVKLLLICVVIFGVSGMIRECSSC